MMNLTHHMLNVESHLFFRGEGDSGFRVQLILVLTETDHTVLLIDKH